MPECWALCGGVGNLMCTKCGTARYCSIACQRYDWRCSHKAVCNTELFKDRARWKTILKARKHNQNTCTILRLPDELILKIIESLSLRTLIAVAASSSRLRSVCLGLAQLCCTRSHHGTSVVDPGYTNTELVPLRGLSAVLSRWKSLSTVILDLSHPTTEGALDAVSKVGVSLQTLRFEGLNGNDTGLRAVAAACPRLRELRAETCPVSNLSIIAVSEACPDLRVLALNGTTVSDPAVEAIAAGCPNLHTLEVAYTSVSDGGALMAATGCTKLKRFVIGELPPDRVHFYARMFFMHDDVSTSKITDECVASIQSMCPQLIVCRTRHGSKAASYLRNARFTARFRHVLSEHQEQPARNIQHNRNVRDVLPSDLGETGPPTAATTKHPKQVNRQPPQIRRKGTHHNRHR